MPNRNQNYLKYFGKFGPKVWFVLILAIFFISVSALKPFSSQQLNPSATPVLSPTTTTTSPGPNPALNTNREQTNGIIAGGILLVLIIVGGTLSVIRQKRKKF